jgi:hypothetical protein
MMAEVSVSPLAKLVTLNWLKESDGTILMAELVEGYNFQIPFWK